MLLRGEPRNFELCHREKRRAYKAEQNQQRWVAYKWFSTLEAALHAILNMKLQMCDAMSLRELKQELENVREELMGYYNTHCDLPSKEGRSYRLRSRNNGA